MKKVRKAVMPVAGMGTRFLEQTKPGRGDEIQLTDGLVTLCAQKGLCGIEMAGRRFDAGDRAGHVHGVLYHALNRADIGADVRVGAECLAAELRAPTR